MPPAPSLRTAADACNAATMAPVPLPPRELVSGHYGREQESAKRMSAYVKGIVDNALRLLSAGLHVHRAEAIIRCRRGSETAVKTR